MSTPTERIMAITLSPTFGEVQQNLRDIFGYVLGEDPESCRAIYGTGGTFGVQCFDLPPASLADPTRLLTKFILTGKANIPATAERLYSTLTFMNGHIIGRVQEEYSDNDNSGDSGVFNQKVISHRKEKYSIQFYHDGAHDTALILNSFLNDPLSSAEIFNRFGMTLTDISYVRNVNEVISAEWEQRAEMDFCVNFTSVIENTAVPYVEGFNVDADGNILALTQSILIKYIDELYSYPIDSLDSVFRIVDENNRFVFPTISGGMPERIVTHDDFMYTRMIRLPHVAVIDFTALPNDDETAENILFKPIENVPVKPIAADFPVDAEYQTALAEYQTALAEYGEGIADSLHRFSPTSLFTYTEDRTPQFTITQVIGELTGTSFTIYCENDFDIGALFDEWATDDPRPVEPVKPIAADYPVAADYQTALADYQMALAEYNAFNMPDIPLPRGNFADGAVGDAAYQAQLDLYNDAINTIIAFRKYVFYNRYALYIVNLTTEKFVSLKANAFDSFDANFVTFNSSNWEVIDHNLENESYIPVMLNSLNDDRVIVGLLRLNLFKAFDV